MSPFELGPRSSIPPELAGALIETPALDALLDRAAFAEVCRSARENFGVQLKVVPSVGGRIETTESVAPPDAESGHAVPLRYDARRLGTLYVIGANDDTVGAKLAAHFGRVIEALLFSGHRAHLASTLHLASAEANYRELAAQNEQLQQAYDKLKELDRLKSTFLATMSHELRTPLTAIIGYSEMLGSGMAGELTPSQMECVDTIRKKGGHLLELIMAVLDVARLEQDQLRVHLAPVDAGELARDVVRTVAPTAAKKGVHLDMRIADNLPQVMADEVRLRQVLLNLLDNAVKFTPDGGSVRLIVSPAALEAPDGDDSGLVLLNAPGRAVEFIVRDSGIGIAKDEQARIFDAFYQVDGSATREHGGAGLGLSIVKRLVEAHGGTIEVTSQVGRGSEFRVRLAAST